MYYEMIGFVSEPGASGRCEEEIPTPDLSRAALFLDFDGTLIDFSPTPDGIDVPDDLPETIARLAEKVQGRLVMVSGRPIENLCRHLKGYQGDVIGAHGAEMRIAGELRQHPAAGSELVRRLGDMVEAFAATHPGLISERKPTGAVLHFRKAPDQDAAAYAFLRALADGHEGFDLHHSKMAYELRPHGISKDASMRRIMESDGYRGASPIYFGDDVTDEPAMHWIAAQEHGMAVKVGPGDTAATFRCADPAAARAKLRAWVAA